MFNSSVGQRVAGMVGMGCTAQDGRHTRIFKLHINSQHRSEDSVRMRKY